MTHPKQSKARKSNPIAFTLTSKERAILNERIKARFNNLPPYSEAELRADFSPETIARFRSERDAADAVRLMLYGVSVSTASHLAQQGIDFVEVETIHRDCFVATNSRGTFAATTYSSAWRRALTGL